jgi:hypothetical protein
MLDRIEQGRLTLGPRSVFVLDEVGLIGTRALLRLLHLRAQHGFRIVALGDPRQCQSLAAGPVIRQIQRALGEDAVPAIVTTVRQKTGREREIAGLFRAGHAAEALAMKRADATALAIPGDHTDAVQAVAALWHERVIANRDTPGWSISISAPTNADARAIAAAIRALRRNDGELHRSMGALGPDQVTIAAIDNSGNVFDLRLAVGDRVRLFASTRASFADGTAGNIGRNASVLTLREIRADRRDGGLVLENHMGRTGFVRWSTLADQESGRIRLSYGDVLTIDSSQGATVTEHIHAMPAGSRQVTGFKAYVAESRHRAITWLVTSDGAERQEIANRRPLGDRRTIQAADVWENIARNLSRQPEKLTALDLIARMPQLRRETARMMQEGLHRAERRRQEGRVAPDLRRAVDRGRTAGRLRGLAGRMAGMVARQRETVARMTEVIGEVAARVREQARNGLGLHD